METSLDAHIQCLSFAMEQDLAFVLHSRGETKESRRTSYVLLLTGPKTLGWKRWNPSLDYEFVLKKKESLKPCEHSRNIKPGSDVALNETQSWWCQVSQLIQKGRLHSPFFPGPPVEKVTSLGTETETNGGYFLFGRSFFLAIVVV